jgi:TetR/AcrR family transcriptional regulator, cholesterol catabolism regulator
MIQEEHKPILELIRLKVLDMKTVDLSFENLSQIPEMPIEKLKQFVSTPEELVEKLLEHELGKFSDILIDIDHDSMNAIDALLKISIRISERFFEIFPSVSPQLKLRYPIPYQTQFQKRLSFVSEKIRINLREGIEQQLYRSDLSTELIARLYISRLIDIHNPELFPLATFSFEVLFNQMFESLIRSIATSDGLSYFEQRKKFYSL